MALCCNQLRLSLEAAVSLAPALSRERERDVRVETRAVSPPSPQRAREKLALQRYFDHEENRRS